MSDTVIRIERLANGYEVEMTDPKIVAENRTPSDKLGGWKDPKICYAFKTEAEVLAFLKSNLAKALPMDEYESSFSKAAMENEDD